MPRYLHRELCRLPAHELELVFRKAKGPALDSLPGYEFRGYNAPAWASLLGIRKFVKGFFRSAEGVEGYNIPVEQNAFDGPWLHRPSAEAPKRFGFYRVAAVDPSSRDAEYPEAVLLDYGASARNPAWRPERVLRDYLVQPDPENPDLLLGKAYLALGSARVASNFFIIERLRRTDWKA